MKSTNLNEKEVKILRSIAKGNDLQGVAKEVYMSYHTVQFHLKKMKGKMECRNVPGLLSKSIRMNIVSL